MRKWYIRKYFKLELFPEKVNKEQKQNKITFNISYDPVFRDVRKILEELHVILASDDRHKKVFPDVPLIGTAHLSLVITLLLLILQLLISIIIMGVLEKSSRGEFQARNSSGMVYPYSSC